MSRTKEPKLHHRGQDLGPLPPAPTPTDVIEDALPLPPVASRESTVWCGMVVVRRFTQRPRVQRLEVSKPRGSGVGENVIQFGEA